ncbi:MAG: cupredoxin domain-containing protein [Candidatus Parcubacteria bacterium]|nr:cupredoxin domain-containing protein [Candidatus Parcubacteria bacterium]
MSPDKIIVIIIGFFAITFIYWFFLMKKSKAVSVSAGSVDITVLGGYSPEVITIPVGKTTRLNFLRTDPSSCLEEVVIGDFHIRKTLPLNEKVSVEITPKKTGEYTYSCGMNMFHGKIIVK